MSDQVAVPALEIADLLSAAGFAVKIRIERATGLNYKRLQLLRNVSLYPDLSVKGHAAYLGIEPTHASYHLIALSAAKCIEPYSDGCHWKLNRRLVFYRTTSTGEAYLSEVRGKAAEAARGIMTGEEVQALREALSRYAFAD